MPLSQSNCREFICSVISVNIIGHVSLNILPSPIYDDLCQICCQFLSNVAAVENLIKQKYRLTVKGLADSVDSTVLGIVLRYSQIVLRYSQYLFGIHR